MIDTMAENEVVIVIVDVKLVVEVKVLQHILISSYFLQIFSIVFFILAYSSNYSFLQWELIVLKR